MISVKINKKVWGLIPARLESSRLPRKALSILHGIPMVVHVAKRSALSTTLDEVVVCTDSPKIAQVCVKYNVKVCITPVDCKNGTERILSAKRRLNIEPNDLIVDIQGDEPLVDPVSIDKVVKHLIEHAEDFGIVLPYIDLCRTMNKNVVKVVSSKNRVIYLTRSDAPYPFNNDYQLKKHLSIIGFSGKSLELFGELPVGDLETIEGIELLRALEGGMGIYTFKIDADSFSVDVLEDLEKANRALRVCPIFQRGY